MASLITDMLKTRQTKHKILSNVITSKTFGAYKENIDSYKLPDCSQTDMANIHRESIRKKKTYP